MSTPAAEGGLQVCWGQGVRGVEGGVWVAGLQGTHIVGFQRDGSATLWATQRVCKGPWRLHPPDEAEAMLLVSGVGCGAVLRTPYLM